MENSLIGVPFVIIAGLALIVLGALWLWQAIDIQDWGITPVPIACIVFGLAELALPLLVVYGLV